jgi:hypothetical protein
MPCSVPLFYIRLRSGNDIHPAYRQTHYLFICLSCFSIGIARRNGVSQGASALQSEWGYNELDAHICTIDNTASAAWCYAYEQSAVDFSKLRLPVTCR